MSQTWFQQSSRGFLEGWVVVRSNNNVHSVIYHHLSGSFSPSLTHKHEMVIFWLASEVLENRLFPKAFHMIPVFDLTMTNRIMYSHSFGASKRFIANIKVQIFYAPLRCQVAAEIWRLGSNRRSSWCGGTLMGGDGSWKYKGRLIVATETKLGIAWKGNELMMWTKLTRNAQVSRTRDMRNL